jgi:hypothetical protein
MSDPTTKLFAALRDYLRATHPRFCPVWLKIIGTDGSRMKLRFQDDYSPPEPCNPSPKEKIP